MIQADKSYTRVYAFIDKDSFNEFTREFGWMPDHSKFRSFLQQTYAVEKTFLFLRYFPKEQAIYESFQKMGYRCVFIPPSEDEAAFVMDIVLRNQEFDRAIIVTGKDEYSILLTKLAKTKKLYKVLYPRAIVTKAFIKHQDYLVDSNTLREEIANETANTYDSRLNSA